MISLDLRVEGIRSMLGGLRFPAPRWLIFAKAQSWGPIIFSSTNW
jgi:hypothetical protein